MVESINRESQKRMLSSLVINSKIFGIFLCLASVFLLAVGLARLFGVKEADASLITKRSAMEGIGPIVQAIITSLSGVYSLKFSKKLRLVKDSEDFNSFMDAVNQIAIIYKIYAIMIYIALFSIGGAFLLWGLVPLLRR
jgi:hypothetical protein